MNPRTTPLTCYHCGNTGVLTYLSQFSVDDPLLARKQYGKKVGSSCGTMKWYFYKCPVCEKPVLANQYIDDDSKDFCIQEIEVIYPTPGIVKEGIPPRIFHAYEAAVKTRGIDNAICLLSLRRALEMVCKDKNAEGKNLESKIDDLIEKKVLPEMMRDACWIVRQCGNEAAHGDDVEFSKREVDEAIEYVGSIIKYLYSTPVKVADLRRRIEKRQVKQKERQQEQNNVDGEENNG